MNETMLADNHPLRRAQWIWPEGYMYLVNHFAQFRKDFSLPKVPKSAPFHITADKAYKLYVNGRFVCRGPARGYQAHWPFDEVDLADYLKRGENWISVEGYQPGISTFQYLHQGWAGLLAAADWGDFKLQTDSSWKMRRSPGHSTQTARYSLQIDFQEHVDLARLDRSWITSPQPPLWWDARLFPHGQSFQGMPFSRPPWAAVEARGIPLLREAEATPSAVVSVGAGESASDYRTRENASWGWVEEGQKVKSWRGGEALSWKKTGEWLQIELPANGPGKFTAFVVDFDEVRVGNLLVEVESATGGEVFDFQHDQAQRQGRPQFLRPGDGCWAAMANRLRPAPGSSEHEFFHLLCFRHVTVIARDLTAPVKLRLRTRTAGYPFEMKGLFESSDETLNSIHAACRRTQQICALDAYVDTPWREQAQWWGDARVQARNTFYLDGDARLLARGIFSLAGQSTPEGLTYGHAPTVANGCILPDFSLTWIMTIWDYFWQTGHSGLFRRLWPRVREVLGYFDCALARTKTGLLRHDRRFWYFGDWADIYKGETPTLLNLYYLEALRACAALLQAEEQQDDASELAAQAAAHEALIRKRLYDESRGLFYGGLDDADRPAGPYSLHDQIMGLILGLLPAPAQSGVEQFCLAYLEARVRDSARHFSDGRSSGLVHVEGRDCGLVPPSAFWCTYLLEQMALRGHGAAVVGFIRDRWQPMLSTGTTWEGFDWNETIGGSATHAWTAHPSFHLVNILAGVRQTAPAWREAVVEPCFAPVLYQVRAAVPTPRGELAVEWRRKGGKLVLQIAAPAEMTVSLRLPDQQETFAGGKERKFELKG